MKKTTYDVIDELIVRYPDLDRLKESLLKAVELSAECYVNGGKILVCGNGGSASDALHIVGELMKSFTLPRRLPENVREELARYSESPDYIFENLEGALSAIALVGETALQTAYANDAAPDLAFAQQVYGYGRKGDVLIGISTSGNSSNVIYACDVAKALKMKVVALTGETGGKLRDKCDVLLNVPEKETFKIQERHLPVYHAYCLALENEFFGE